MDSNDIYKRKCVTCLSCKKEISKSNFNKHYNSKSCRENTSKKKRLNNCPHCNILLSSIGVDSANHIRWCEYNPKRKYYNTKTAVDAMKESKRKTKRFNHFETAKLDGLPIPNGYWKNKEGPFKGKRFSEETKEKIRKKALSNDYQRVCKKSHRYIDKHGREFTFDSSWEDALADRLDELDIKWNRPDPIRYNSKGKIKRYYPDFYLIDYNLYLDPKNEYCLKQQKEKIDIVSSMINLIILTSLNQCKNWSPPVNLNHITYPPNF